MLDTNTASFIIRGSESAVNGRLRSSRPTDLCISAITEGEMRFGLSRRPGAHRLEKSVEAFLMRIEVLPWDRAAARSYGRLRAELERVGAALGALDMLIAAHALATDAVLVTHDKAFARAPGLDVIDWMVL